MSIAPQFISPDLTAYKDDILAYAASGKVSPVTYKTGTDGVLSGNSLTSASATFSSTQVGMYVALQGIGYALVTASPSEHVLTLDTSFSAATAVRYCVGAHAAIERDAFNAMKNEAVYGWSRTIMDTSGLPRAVRVKGLIDITGSTVADYDFMTELASTSTLFNEAHKYGTMWRIFRKEAIQGGQTWRDNATQYQLDYYGALQTAVDSLARTLVDEGTVMANSRTGDIVFARMERI